jgi:hypothetical protein
MRSTGRVPIFIISFNRLSDLQRSIESYQRLSTPVDIVVHDNGSTHPGLLDYLNELSKDGCLVTFNAPLGNDPNELNSVNATIERYFGAPRSTAPFVVTDPDVSLDTARADALEVYAWLLATQEGIACAGPMLRIDDIPAAYPLRDRAIVGHVEQFWHKRPTILRSPYGQVAVQTAMIDTTFALYPAGAMFKRLTRGMRVYHPFEARHLTWYLDPAQLTEDAQRYRTESSEIAHWNNETWEKQFLGMAREPQTIYVVRTAGLRNRKLRVEELTL